MYNTIKFFLPAAAALIIFSACPPVTWEYLDTSCNVSEIQDYFFEDYITIDFSLPPDKREAEKMSQLKTNKGLVSAEYRWDNSRLYIRPETLWQKGARYTFTLEGSLRMENGGAYTVNIERTFQYGAKEGGFYLVSDAATPASLNFVFNKAPSVVSFNEKFSLSPQSDTNTLFSNNGETVTVKTVNGWAFNTIYTWSIKDVVSEDGYVMTREYGDTFYGPADTEAPKLLTVCPVDYGPPSPVWHTGSRLDGTLLEQQAIGFVFSKPMEESSVRSGISFYPHVNGYVIKENGASFIFIPEERYQTRKEYRLTVAKTINDISGLPLFEDALSFFTTANNYLTVTEVRFDDIYIMPADGSINDFTIKSQLEIQTEITFGTAIPASLRKKATDSISLEALFPLSAAAPVLVSSFWDDSGVKLTWQGFTRSTGSIAYFYILTVKGGKSGVVNGAGEYQEEDVCVVFKAL